MAEVMHAEWAQNRLTAVVHKSSQGPTPPRPQAGPRRVERGWRTRKFGGKEDARDHGRPQQDLDHLRGSQGNEWQWSVF